MFTPLLWLTVTITASTILIPLVLGLGFYRRSQALARGGPPPPVAWLVNLLLAGWLLLAGTLAGRGLFAAPLAGRVPALALALVPLGVGGALFAWSPAFRQTLAATPPSWLAFHYP